MENTYTPDVWRVVSLTNQDNETHHRIIAGWHGGYIQGESWKLSSGIEKIIDKKTHWEMPQTSGSVYFCHKNNEELSRYTESIINNLTKNATDVTISLVDISTILEKYQ